MIQFINGGNFCKNLEESGKRNLNEGTLILENMLRKFDFEYKQNT